MRIGSQPGCGRLARESVSGQRRDDEVERVLGAPAMRGRVGERADDLQLLDDRAGPAVGDDHGQRARVRGPHMDEVDVESVDVGDELRQLVQACLARRASRAATQRSASALSDVELHALRGVVDDLALGPAGLADAAVQVIEIGLRELRP